MSSTDPDEKNTVPAKNSPAGADIDPEMLKHLSLLVNYESLDSEDLWDDFVKNFSELDQAIKEETEKELEDENQ